MFVRIAMNHANTKHIRLVPRGKHHCNRAMLRNTEDTFPIGRWRHIDAAHDDRRHTDGACACDSCSQGAGVSRSLVPASLFEHISMGQAFNSSTFTFYQCSHRMCVSAKGLCCLLGLHTHQAHVFHCWRCAKQKPGFKQLATISPLKLLCTMCVSTCVPHTAGRLLKTIRKDGSTENIWRLPIY